MRHEKRRSQMQFNNGYVSALRSGNPGIRDHFAAYFNRELDIWLRSRLHNRAAVEDVRQETLCRVFRVIVQENGIRDGARLEQFVTGTCKNVLLEYWRKSCDAAETEDCPDIPTYVECPEKTLLVSQKVSLLRDALTQLPAQEQALLTMLYIEELDRSEVSRRIGISRGHLRVMAHRAMERLRAKFNT